MNGKGQVLGLGLAAMARSRRSGTKGRTGIYGSSVHLDSPQIFSILPRTRNLGAPFFRPPLHTSLSLKISLPRFLNTQVFSRSHDTRGEGHENPTARILAPIRTLLPPKRLNNPPSKSTPSRPIHIRSSVDQRISINTTPRSWLTNTYVCPSIPLPPRRHRSPTMNNEQKTDMEI